MAEPNVSRGYAAGQVPPSYVWTGTRWEPPSTPTLIGWPGGPLGMFTVQDPGGQVYSWGKMTSPEIYIEGLGWRPKEQGSLMYPDSPEGRMYSAASGYNWIDRTPKPAQPLTQADANAWLRKVGATSVGTMTNAYNALPSYNATTASQPTATQKLANAYKQQGAFQPELDYNPFPNYYGRR